MTSTVVLRPPWVRRIWPAIATCGFAYLLLIFTTAEPQPDDPALVDMAFVVIVALGAVVTAWWQCRARVTVDPEGTTTYRLGRGCRIERDAVIDVSRLWGRTINVYHPRLGTGVGLSVAGLDGRGRPRLIHLDPRSPGFDDAMRLFNGWASADPSIVRDPYVAKAFSIDVPKQEPARLSSALAVSGQVVEMGLVAWLFVPGVMINFLNSGESAFAMILSVLVVLYAVGSTVAWFASRRVVETDSLRHGLPRRTTHIRDFVRLETADPMSWRDHPSVVPRILLTLPRGIREQKLDLVPREDAAELFVFLDGWVAARPELVQDDRTQAWFVARGVLPHGAHEAAITTEKA